MRRRAQPGDGNVYVKDGMLWLWWYTAERDDKGKLIRDWMGTGLRPGQEKTATEALTRIRLQVLAEVATGERTGPMTLGRWGESWFKERDKDGVGTVNDERSKFRHAKSLHDTLLEDLKIDHFQDLVRQLKARIGPKKEDMAPRSVLAVYAILRQMLGVAVARKLIPVNPCVVEKKDLPRKRDKLPFWRSTAVYRRDEVEALISDARVPEERRTLYGLLFLGGKRIGEVAALDWADYDATREPLGALLISKSFNRKKLELKGTKTETPREIPVHPTLAHILASWRLGGWERYMGRIPKPEDILVPTYRDNRLRDPTVLQNLHRDLAALGMRARRTHDTRRTLISLARGDGANLDILKWITHGPSGSILDLYTELPWESLCTEITKLKLELREGRIVELRQVANSSCDGGCDGNSGTHQNICAINKLQSEIAVPKAGFEPAFRPRSGSVAGRKPARALKAVVGGLGSLAPLAPTTVTASQKPASPIEITAALEEASAAWEASHNPDQLRHHLHTLLSLLDGGGR